MSNESVPESNSTPDTPSTSSGPIEVPVGDGMAEFTSAPAAESTTAEEAAKTTESAAAEEVPVEEPAEPQEDFANILKEFERGHARTPGGGAKQGGSQIEGTVISVSAEQVFVDIGYKIEGVLPRSAFRNNAEAVKAGEKVFVSIKGRNEEGYYDLMRFKVA